MFLRSRSSGPSTCCPVILAHHEQRTIRLLTPLYNTIKMRSFFLFSLLVAAASAFVAPANQAVGKCKLFWDDSWTYSVMGQFNCDDVINLVLQWSDAIMAEKSNMREIHRRREIIFLDRYETFSEARVPESVHIICSNFRRRSPSFLPLLHLTNYFSLQPCLHRWSTKDDDRWIRSWLRSIYRQLDRHKLWWERWTLLPRCRYYQSCRPHPLPCSSSCRRRVNLWRLFENIINLFYLHKLYLFLAMEWCGWVFCGQLLNAEWDRLYSRGVPLSSWEPSSGFLWILAPFEGHFGGVLMGDYSSWRIERWVASTTRKFSEQSLT